MALLSEIHEIHDAVLSILRETPRLTTAEVAERLGKEEEVIKTVMQSMYVDQLIKPLYVYEIGDTTE